jgi:hypothetical protein
MGRVTVFNWGCWYSIGESGALVLAFSALKGSFLSFWVVAQSSHSFISV